MTTSSAGRRQRDELDALEHRALVGRPNREADRARRLGQHVRHLRQDRLDSPIGAVATKPGLDRVGRAARSLVLEQQVNIKAVTAIGWNPAGRRVGLLDEPFLLQGRQDVPDRR